MRGVVQGVGYRASTLRKATQLGLTGWVRNEPDGSVLLEAQGARERIDELEQWLWRGPVLADVEAVEVEELDPADGERTFSVRN